MKYVKIDNDMFEDAGKVWFVHEYSSNPNTTAVKLKLEDTQTGEIHSRVVPQNQIEWVEKRIRMLYTGSGNIPNHIYCWVDSSFIRRNAKPFTYEPCVWFALHSKSGCAWGCHIMLECGAVYRGVPPHALAFNQVPEQQWKLYDSQIWDCYGDQFSVVTYNYLYSQRAEIRKSGLFGRYLFTVIPMYDGFTQEPTQSKEFMFIQLDNGRLCIMPTNELRFHDKSYTEGDWPKDLKLSNNVWRVE